MKKVCASVLACLLLAGCATNSPVQPASPETAETISVPPTPEYASQFLKETRISLSDEGIAVDGNQESVTTSHDIVYYEDRDTYDSGNPYGEGSASDRHTAEEAAAHTVVNITRPGAYRISGKLSSGQIRVDLGEDASDDPDAVVELILDNADITCTVAPAILFQNVYECNGDWSVDTAKANVDTSAAGANLILEGSNTVSGSYVAKIYKDAEGEKKLCKQDGAIYSYMSMNVFGPGSLELTAENEGLDTELHLTINGGNITIRSGNDGINTNEDGVSVTTINGGNVRIVAGLGEEGDGIDSNGYLVINGGTVVASANPAADAGLDSDLGSYVHGGTVIAMGSAMDWAESDSEQVTMNLQFARQQSAGSKITITREDGTKIFSFEDDGPDARPFSGLILSHFGFAQGENYHVFIDGVQQTYTGSDLHGGMGGRGPMSEGMEPPEGEIPQMPEGMEPGQPPELPEGETFPADFDPAQRGGGRDTKNGRPFGGAQENMTPPDGFEHGFPNREEPGNAAEGSTVFYMQDKVNAFSGIDSL